MDPRVEVMHLGGELCEVEPTSVEVQSNESERPPVNGAILADVGALHKAHINIEEEGIVVAGASVCACPSALGVRCANEPMEIKDR